MTSPHVPTPSQTVGPFFNYGLTTNPALGILASEGTKGEKIWLSLRILDSDGKAAASDAMVEIWQADADGQYPGSLESHFSGFGRLETNLDGACVFETVKPGRVPLPNGQLQAPHINVIVFARGLLRHLFTRVYFADEPANMEDHVLGLIPSARRHTVLANPVADQASTWHMDIRLQGESETVFFDI